jgi:transposase
MEQGNLPYAAWIGIDWGSERHAVCLQITGSEHYEHSKPEQNANILREWVVGLQQRFDGRKVAVVIEQSKGAVINFLLEWRFIDIYRVHPKSLKNYRDAVHPSEAKDDPEDAQLLVTFGQLQREKIKPWVPDTEDARLLQRLVEFRRKTVQKRVALSNELTQLLKEYFPQALEWAGELSQKMALDFLERWPTLEKLQKSKPGVIRRFYQQHRCRSVEQIQKRIEEILGASGLTSDRAILESSQMMMQTMVGQIRSIVTSIEELEAKIQEIYRRQPDAEIFDSFPGAGATLAPRLQSVVGSDRGRFSSAQELAEYSGIAPVTKRSGKTKYVQHRWKCCAYVKQSFHEWAGQTIQFCTWAKAFYSSKRAEGMKHHAAVRALAYKWIRIMYACWKHHALYNDEHYLMSLRQSNPNWLKFLPMDTKTFKNA